MKDFQELVLDELRSLRQGQDRIEGRITNLEEGQKRLEERVTIIEKKLDAVYEQTADLTEFRVEVNKKLDLIKENHKSMHEMLGEHDIAIRTLRRRPV